MLRSLVEQFNLQSVFEYKGDYYRENAHHSLRLIVECFSNTEKNKVIKCHYPILLTGMDWNCIAVRKEYKYSIERSKAMLTKIGNI